MISIIVVRFKVRRPFNELNRRITNGLKSSLREFGLSFNSQRYLKFNPFYMRDRVEDRKIKISFRIETRSRFMYRPAFFFGYFSTYTTSHFENNLYFGHNERRFYSEFHSRVKSRLKSCMIQNRVFDPE